MTKRRRKLDVRDIQAIREMQNTRGWKLVCERVVIERKRKAEALINPASELDTAMLRGAVRMCDTVLEIPDILISEAKLNKGAVD